MKVSGVISCVLREDRKKRVTIVTNPSIPYIILTMETLGLG